jgi:guanylate kinase
MNVAGGGQLIIISGPSGAGKSTVVGQLLETCDLPLERSISATTRQPRPGEEDGVDYYFISQEEFAERRQRGEFLECAEVFGSGNWYGTLEEPVRRQLQEGRRVILEIDVQGARQVLQRFPEATSIFIHPGSLEELEKRLRGRESETEEQIRNRLSVAADELRVADSYQHIVKNESVQATAATICGLLNKTGEQKSCTTN